MDLEIVGRHALFFDDDSMAMFVNTPTALVDWNSLLIDRYDVRHLLSSPPPPRLKRRRQVLDDPDLELELDHERYLDLPAESPSPSHDENDINDVSEDTNADSFRAVPFSYGSSSDFNDQKNADMESGFHPPFPVPDYLLQHLLVSFCCHDRGRCSLQLRSYIRSSLELKALSANMVDKEEAAYDSKTNESAEVDDGVKVADFNGLEGSKGSVKVATERGADSNQSLLGNDQASFVKRNPSLSAVNVLERKHINTENNATEQNLTHDKSQSSAMLVQPKLELPIVEPPAEMKRVIDKIVDFIQKNGKELEATLVAQDVKYGMFPFLRPASLYHSYYRKVLQEAEELKLCDKGISTKKEDVRQEKMGNAVKDDKSASGSVLPDDSAKKEKLKMGSDKSNVELHNKPFKPVQPQMRVNVDVNTAAAILQAARRGIRNPQLEILSGKPWMRHLRASEMMDISLHLSPLIRPILQVR